MQRLDAAQVSPSYLAQKPGEAQKEIPVSLPEPGSTGEAEAAPADHTYDAFISYRRGQGRRVASWLSHKLERYRPKEILKQLPPVLRERLQKPHRVFLDTRYERSNKDFWDAHIAPALTNSQRLIVISTADAFEPRSDGSPNWVEREIDTYWAQYHDPERISVALAPGAPEDRYPGRLGAISERWDWADLRGYRPFYWLLPWRAAWLEDAFAKLVAGVYDIPVEFVPVLRREERRRHNRWRLSIVAGLLILVGLSGFGGYQWHERNLRAEEAQARMAQRLGTEAQQRLLQPITQETSPLIAALAATGWRMGKVSDAWNAMQRIPLITELARVTHDGPVSAVAFSPDGKLLATAGDDNTARLWAVVDGRQLARLAHDGPVRAVAFSPDGTRLATASSDGTARLWAVPDGRELARITHDEEILTVAFSPDGTRLATAGLGNTVHLWSTVLDDMLRQLCASQGRNLSLDEWRQYLPELDWSPTCENWLPTKDDPRLSGGLP